MRRNTIAKLAAPTPAQMVHRPRVVQALGEMLQDSHAWLAAPGGYGKTTAAADYLQRRGGPFLWCRLDEDDQDPASFYHYLGLALDPADAAALPTFSAEYADQPLAFARRFFRAFFAALPDGLILVLDDVQDAECEAFDDALASLLREAPPHVRCLFLSRTLPADRLRDAALAGRLRLAGGTLLEFSDTEARQFFESRGSAGAAAMAERAGGWAAGLALLAERSASAELWPSMQEAATGDEPALFDLLGRRVFDVLPAPEQDMLLKLGLLPEITPRLAAAMVGSSDAAGLLEHLHRRQFLVSRLQPGSRAVFRLHDLLRDFLARRLEQAFTPADRQALTIKAAEALAADGRPAQAIDLALRGGAHDLAARLMAQAAETALEQGRRATFLDWCARLKGLQDPWLCYWRGVAHLPDDQAAEPWLERAFAGFDTNGDERGRRLAVARAVLVKSDSWRTHTGLSVWTARAMRLLEAPPPALSPNDELLVLMGLLRALDFADDYGAAAPFAARLSDQLSHRLLAPQPGDSANLRLLASAGVIEHAGSADRPELFARAVDAVAESLESPGFSPWVLGLWLVAFGAVSGRCFPYERRGFPYPDAEAALRAAIELGEREGFAGVEFGGLYHLQYQLKLQNRWEDYPPLVDRLAKVADSRHSTQVAVVADCQAALHTWAGRIEAADAACDRFLVAIEAAGEPPIERWPHYVTRFQMLVAGGRLAEGAAYMRSLAPQFDAVVADRTLVCAQLAEALMAKAAGEADYAEKLTGAVEALRRARWTAVFANLPHRLAEVMGDALELGVAPDFCASLIGQRRLAPPSSRPQAWPWPLRIHVLGGLRLERDGAPLASGPKPPARALDLLRALAVAPDHACALADFYDWLWPDLDGDQAKAACEQALQRLRRLLGRADFVVQREGRLRLRMDLVWVDLDHWWTKLRADPQAALASIPGSVLPEERDNPWVLAAADRLRRDVIEAALLASARLQQAGDAAGARALRQRTADVYPDAARIYHAMIAARLASNDMIGAWEDYARFERACPEPEEEDPALAIRDLLRRSAASVSPAAR